MYNTFGRLGYTNMPPTVQTSRTSRNFMIFLQRYWHDSMTTPLAKQKLKFPAAVPIENQAALDWRQKQRKTVLSAACARQTVRPRPSVGRRFAARTLKNVFHVCAALYNVPIPPGVSTNLWCRRQRWRSKKHVPSARNASCSCKGGDYVPSSDERKTRGKKRKMSGGFPGIYSSKRNDNSQIEETEQKRMFWQSPLS